MEVAGDAHWCSFSFSGEDGTHLFKKSMQEVKMDVMITKNYFNVFSYEEEQKNKANISGRDNWVDGKLEIKGAVMGER